MCCQQPHPKPPIEECLLLKPKETISDLCHLKMLVSARDFTSHSKTKAKSRISKVLVNKTFTHAKFSPK